MTIKKRLYISFSMILLIIVFIIGVFFYTIFNLNSIHLSQNDKYDKIIDELFINIDTNIDLHIAEDIGILKNELQEIENDKDDFIDKIKIELLVLLFIAFALSFIISTKLINEIKVMLSKLNSGVLQLLSNDENSIKIDLGKNNELSQITTNLNSYLEKQEEIIHSREELLRNISHELKTPITKGKFLIEQIKQSADETLVKNINNVFYDIETLTSKLLEREKLNFAVLNQSIFKVTTLILESLSKLSIDDESKVEVNIIDDFSISGDFYYLTIVLKNLIDNAMKYSIKYPITIESIKDELYIKNSSNKLSNDLIYYLQPFTREPNQQLGHGLGLNIVNKILQMHDLSLLHKYENSQNVFFIFFDRQQR